MKASRVAIKQSKSLERLEAKLDLLLSNAGISYEENQPIEPTKTYIEPEATPDAEPVAEVKKVSKKAKKARR